MTDQQDRDRSARDVERRLATFLGDDTFVQAPDRAIEAAMAHARANPRRRDVLAAVRRDPMDGWARVIGLRGAGVGGAGVGGVVVGRGMPRVLLVASLGLLLVAAFAVASVGGLFDRPAIVPPDASPSLVPSLAPSPAASPSLPPIQTVRVDLSEVSGLDAFVEITDESLMVESAMSGSPRDGGSTDGISVVVTQGSSPSTIVLTWTGAPCDTGHQLMIDPDGRTMRLFRPRCEGDAVPRDLVLELTFDRPIAPADVSATLETVE